MNRTLPSGVAVAALLLACACGTAPGTVARDVEAYLARARQWAPVEAETARTIDRIGKGIGSPFAAGVLKEMTGADDFAVESREQKDGFLIEKGKGKGDRATSVIAYRRLPDKALKGLVIYFQ